MLSTGTKNASASSMMAAGGYSQLEPLDFHCSWSLGHFHGSDTFHSLLGSFASNRYGVGASQYLDMTSSRDGSLVLEPVFSGRTLGSSSPFASVSMYICRP